VAAAATTTGAVAAATTTGAVASTTAGRRPGRPRAAGVDEALLAATIELAGEVGISAMSMDDLAQRAGVSKATIYRRWPSKEALVLDALSSAIRPLDVVDTGSVRRDLEVFLAELVHRMRTGRTSDILPELIAASVRDPALRASLDEWVRQRRQPLAAILRRAVDREELPADTDVETLVDALMGPLVYRRLLSHDPLDDRFVAGLLAMVLD
jgi:AcrR family transcriptional regulator